MRTTKSSVPTSPRAAGSVIVVVAPRGGASQLAIGDDMIRRYLAAYADLVLRLVFSPRWIMWHVLTLGAVITCGLLAAWQWRRAGSAMGSALNIGYGLQWPLFSVFFAVMWFRMLRLEIRRVRGEQPDEMAPPPEPIAPPVASGSVSSGSVSSGSASSGPESSGSSPFTPRPPVAAPSSPPITDESDPELAAYNRMLALLAERDQARQDTDDRIRQGRGRAHENRTH